jgi:hypothetical protein
MVGSALLYKGKLYTGKRHHLCIHHAHIETGDYSILGEQGFVTSTGEFLTREEAEVQARACGQLTKPLIGSVLTSEDLW